MADVHDVEILCFVPHYPPAVLGGGPARTLEGMVNACASPAMVAVVTADHDHGADTPLPVESNAWLMREGAWTWYSSPGLLRVARTMRAAARLKPRYVYLNSVFHPVFAILPMLLKRLGAWGDAELVIAPRGELDPGALRLKTRKKNTYLAVARRLGLLSRATWHTSTDIEATFVAAELPSARRFLVKENETVLPRQALPRSTRPRSEPRSLVYVGRISPKKQLELLFEGLARVERDFRLEIVGAADDAAYLRRMEALASRLDGRVHWHGPASRDEVFERLAHADIACFPTAGENFGHVIAEALASSCPVVIMDVTPWTKRVRDGGGEIVEESTALAWGETLDRMLAEPVAAVEARSRAAAAAYESWRDSVDGRSLFDYLLQDQHDALVAGPGPR